MFQRYIKCTFLLIRNSEQFSYKQIRNIWTQSTNNGSLMVRQADSDRQNRSVPLTASEFKDYRAIIPEQPENPRLLKVSVLGEPNVGKSTLTNRLVKWRVCAVSKKVHTTRKKARAVLVEDNTQIVFFDTPGFVSPETSKKHSLEATFIMDPVMSIREADLIAVVVDISDKWTNHRISTNILRTLYDFKEKKSILILNKIDAVKVKSQILHFTRILTDGQKKKRDKKDEEITMEDISKEFGEHSAKDIDSDYYENIEWKKGWPLFSKVFMVSALKDDGVEDLRNYLLSEAVPHDWIYHEGIVTDQHPHDIVLTTVREKLLEYLPNEIPYTINLKILKWEMLSTGCPKIDIQIQCPNSRHRSFVIGPNGKHIGACADKCKKALKESFRRDVVLKLVAG